MRPSPIATSTATSSRSSPGIPAGTALAISGDPAEAVPPPDTDGTADRAIARDPKWRALGQQADALSRSAKLLAQTFKPSVNAEARYAYVPRGFGYDKYYLSFQENVASVGVSVVLPLLTGGHEAAQEARSRARLEQVLAERSLREADLTQAARQAEARLAQASLETGIARRAAAIAEESLAQARALAREGRGEADGVARAGARPVRRGGRAGARPPGRARCPAAAARPARGAARDLRRRGCPRGCRSPLSPRITQPNRPEGRIL